MMLSIVFTLDYEVHGNGEGCPLQLMVESTDRLLRQLDRFGAKATIMADVAEILRFKDYREATGHDDFYSEAIEGQLCEAIGRGHDVQLHLHSSWFKAKLEGGKWLQNWDEYSFAELPAERIDQYLARGKMYLESLLKPVKADYRCIAFRAANWSMFPSGNVARALVKHDFRIETSVFKWGVRTGRVAFDYSHAHHHLHPWPADMDNICREDPGSDLWEFPIYAERRWIGAFLSPNRIYRACQGRLHRIPKTARISGALPDAHGEPAEKPNPFGLLARRHAWKADFNQCTGRQLVNAVERAHGNKGSCVSDLPFVMIGHSKLYTRSNARSLDGFLKHIRSNNNRYRFATLTGVVPEPERSG